MVNRPKWSNEITNIKIEKYTNPPTYFQAIEVVKKFKISSILKKLQKTQHTDSYLVEKIIRKNGYQLLVEWLKLDNKHNSWIHKHDVVQNVFFLLKINVRLNIILFSLFFTHSYTKSIFQVIIQFYLNNNLYRINRKFLLCPCLKAV